MDLEKRWCALWPETPVIAMETYENLARRYAEKGRTYHNLAHIGSCLAELDAVWAFFDRRVVEIALWYHDVVYDPKANDNEEKSIDFAFRELNRAGLLTSFGYMSRINDLILATRHLEPTQDLEEQLIADIDLHTLGQSAEIYEAYARAIRFEYAWVPEELYRAGRSKILGRFLDREYIYYTRGFRKKYEKQARRNLAVEIQALTA